MARAEMALSHQTVVCLGVHTPAALLPKSISNNRNDNDDCVTRHFTYITFSPKDTLGTFHILPLVLKALKAGNYHLCFPHEETEAQTLLE